MQYFKVKPQYDNKTRYRWNNHRQGVPYGILIANELYTPCEYKRLAMCPAWFDTVEIPKNKIYWFFGARFEMEVTQ